MDGPVEEFFVEWGRGPEGFEGFASAFDAEAERIRHVNRIVPVALRRHHDAAWAALLEESRKEGKPLIVEDLARVIASLQAATERPEGRLPIQVDSPALRRELLDQFTLSYVTFAAPGFVHETSLVYLVSRYEEFLRQCAGYALWHVPEALRTSRKQLTYEEVYRHGSMEALHAAIVDKEVAALLALGVEEWDRAFQERFGVRLAQGQDGHAFRERFHRRNALIHSGGLPDAAYRRRTGYEGPATRLKVDEAYLMESLRLFSDQARDLATQMSDRFAARIAHARQTRDDAQATVTQNDG